MDKREFAKKSGDKHLSQSIKILMNSFYGVMGTPLSRFYNPNLSYGITGTGQWLLNTCKDYLESKNYNVIYGDTDSLFIQLKEDERAYFNKSATLIMDNINNYLTELIKKDFNVVSKLEMEYEKHFIKFFSTRLKGWHSWS